MSFRRKKLILKRNNYILLIANFNLSIRYLYNTDLTLGELKTILGIVIFCVSFSHALMSFKKCLRMFDI